MSNYDAILFDVDGTLIDSAPGIRKSFAHTFCKLGVNDAGIDYNQFLGPPLRKSFEKYVGPDKTERAVDIYREYYKEIGQYLCQLYPGAKEMLHTLQERGLTLCTATSKPTTVVQPILERLDVEKCFAFVGGASMDESVDTKEDVIRLVLRQPALQNKNVLMVGDRRDDMAGANACHLHAAGVLYGYGNQAEMLPFAPDFFAENCAELTRYILSDKRRTE